MDDTYKTIIDTLLRPAGNGMQREVFSIRYADDKVIKVCVGRTIQNVIEFDIWASFSEAKEGKKWLAECYDLSDDGRVLVQERLNIFSDINDPRLPEKVPNCMTDLKVQNWGVDQDGNVKCCDYGSTLILQEEPWKLKKANWWTDE